MRCAQKWPKNMHDHGDKSVMQNDSPIYSHSDTLFPKQTPRDLGCVRWRERFPTQALAQARQEGDIKSLDPLSVMNLYQPWREGGVREEKEVLSDSWPAHTVRARTHTLQKKENPDRMHVVHKDTGLHRHRAVVQDVGIRVLSLLLLVLSHPPHLRRR